MKTRSLLPLAVLLIGTAALSQGVVSPAAFAKTEGPSYSNYPFGWRSNQGIRYLQIHDDLKGTKRTIRSLALRRDGSLANRFMAFSCQVTVFMSTAKTTSTTPNKSFDSNHGTNKKRVLFNSTISMPPTSRQSIPATNFDYEVKLATPFVFDGSGPLAWEMQTTVQKNYYTTVYFDYAYSTSTSPALATGTFASGCVNTSRIRAMSATGSSSMNYRTGKGVLYLNGNYMPAVQVAFGLIGFSRTNLGAIPLPLLFAGSSNAYSGPCYLRVSLDIILPVPTNSSGGAQVQLPVPADAKLSGFHVYGQFLAPDLKSKNAFNLTTSNGVEYCWVAPYGTPPIGSVLANSSISFTGTAYKSRGVVTRFN